MHTWHNNFRLKAKTNPRLLFRLLCFSHKIKVRFAVPFYSNILFRHDRRDQLRGGDVKARVVYPAFSLSDRARRDEHLGLNFIARSIVSGGVEGATNEAGFQRGSMFDRDAIYGCRDGVSLSVCGVAHPEPSVMSRSTVLVGAMTMNAMLCLAANTAALYVPIYGQIGWR